MSQNKKSLGEVIYATLQTFYPNTKLGISIKDVNEILDKAKITKKNVKKEEISKIIKILRGHVEQALVVKNPINQNHINQNPINQNPINQNKIEDKKFPEMEKVNNNIDKLNMEYYNNLEQMRQQDITINNKKEIPKLEDRNKILEKLIDYYIIIDSHCRNQDTFSNPSEYTLDFTNTRTDGEDSYSIPVTPDLNNIQSIELIECIISDNLFNYDYYIVLEIDEVGKNLSSNNKSLNNCFTRLTKFNIVDNYKGKYRVYDIPEGSLKYFTPERNFSSISIRLKNSKGELIIFNRENDDIEPLFNSFKFKFSKMEKSMDTSMFM